MSPQSLDCWALTLGYVLDITVAGLSSLEGSRLVSKCEVPTALSG